eukprot:GHVP01048772.1.p1 GENE.GHVP01048772.1~~GHVP01048772.1.p1  ORF type:complete len:521 (+),score=79.12 GHVP01048772.1:51-1613(+)
MVVASWYCVSKSEEESSSEISTSEPTVECTDDPVAWIDWFISAISLGSTLTAASDSKKREDQRLLALVIVRKLVEETTISMHSQKECFDDFEDSSFSESTESRRYSRYARKNQKWEKVNRSRPSEKARSRSYQGFNTIRPGVPLSVMSQITEARIAVYRYGSYPLGTTLPDSDVDIGIAIFHPNGDLEGVEVADTFLTMLHAKMLTHSKEANEFQIQNVRMIDANCRVLKANLHGFKVDICANKISGCCTLLFLEYMNRFLGGDDILKRSIILLKAWCKYEARILNSSEGLLSTCALEILVLALFVMFPYLRNTSPFEIFRYFLGYYKNFPWQESAMTACGPVALASIEEASKNHPPGSLPSFEILASQENEKTRKAAEQISQIRREVVHVYAAYGGGSKTAGFSIRSLNIIDPLNNGNNLGRSVSSNNAGRVCDALRTGWTQLQKVQLKQSYEDCSCTGEDESTNSGETVSSSQKEHSNAPDLVGASSLFPCTLIRLTKQDNTSEPCSSDLNGFDIVAA